MSPGPIHQTSTLQALMSLLKCYIGTGILSMPMAFAHSGYVIGIIGTTVIGILCNCCIHMLVEINDAFCAPGQIPYDYEGLAKISFENGPLKWQKYASLSRRILISCLTITQLGFSCAYSLFIAKNLLQFCINLRGDLFAEEHVVYFLLGLLPILILANFLKKISHLAIASTIANIIQLASLLIIIYNLFIKLPSINERKAFNIEIPQFVSATAFTFEGITVTMPLYRSMKRRENFAKPFGVINLAITFVITLYSTVGFLGYLKYGDNVGASITLSLPNERLYAFVQLMYAFAILCSHTMQMYVAIQLTWPTIKNYLMDRKKSENTINTCEYLWRAFLVTLTVVIAAVVPELDLVIELIGAFSCSSVALIIPSVLHLVAFTERSKGFAKGWLYFKNLTIICLGFLACITGTYFSLEGILQLFTHNRHKAIISETIITSTTTIQTIIPDVISQSTTSNTTKQQLLWFQKLMNMTSANNSTIW